MIRINAFDAFGLFSTLHYITREEKGRGGALFGQEDTMSQVNLTPYSYFPRTVKLRQGTVKVISYRSVGRSG